MRKKIISLTIILALIVGIILSVMPAKVLAVTDDAIDFNDWENQGDKSTIGGEQTPSTETPSTEKPSTETPSTEKPSTPTTETPKKENTDIPKAGLAENTMAVVAMVVLVITALYAYKKINDYKNI